MQQIKPLSAHPGLCIGGCILKPYIFFCPGKEAMWDIVASPSCTKYHCGSLIAFYVRRINRRRAPALCLRCYYPCKLNYASTYTHKVTTIVTISQYFNFGLPPQQTQDSSPVSSLLLLSQIKLCFHLYAQGYYYSSY